MSVRNRIDCGNSRNRLRSAARRIRHATCIAIILSTLPLVSGCGPELLIGGLLTLSAISAHMDKGSFPARRPDPMMRRRVQQRNLQNFLTYHDKDKSSETKPVKPAPSRSDQAEHVSPVTEALHAYREMRWDQAGRILNNAIGMKGLSKSELSRAYIILGAMEYQTGRAEAAQEHFVKAHQHDSTSVPSSELFPPQMIEFYITVNRRKKSNDR